jgi:hypothetical protein
MALVGPRSFMPLAAKTKKQSCVSHSTLEAEIVSINLAMRTLGVPALSIWDLLLDRDVGLDVMDDNDATITIINTGKNPALRHVSRTHVVNVAWLYEMFKRLEYRLYYQPTVGQCSDLFTKPFSVLPAWRHACDLIGIITGDVAGRTRGGANALPAYIERVRSAQALGRSKTSGDD